MSGKVVVVTGIAGGIGKMLAEGLLRAGATVYISSRKGRRPRRDRRRLVVLGRIDAVPATCPPPAGIEGAHQTTRRTRDRLHALFQQRWSGQGAYRAVPDLGVGQGPLRSTSRGCSPLTKAATAPTCRFDPTIPPV
ncbi:hypothetical protein HBB16_13600 [Pseudonocardia sp. MCCB 268]|nr:hypothetical protein [Pseudonocardia cytotoxica]